MSRLVLTNANVIDDTGPSRAGQIIVIDGDRISSVGAGLPASESAPQAGDRIVDLGGRSVIAGMASCHFHSTYTPIRSGPFGMERPPSYQALMSHRNLLQALQHGFTTVIGAGAARDIEPGVKLAIEEGQVLGPRFVPSGRELSTTGHANDAAVPWHWQLTGTGGVRVCDGPEEFRFAVRDEVKRGVEVIKLFVTGGHGVPGSKDRMEMTRDELAAAIDTAHDRGVLARGHIAGKRVILLAIELGIDIVDHCDDMDEEVIAALVETSTYVVPSLLYPKVQAEMMEARRPGSAEGIRRTLAFSYEALPKADAAGVRLLLGDDFGGPGLEHGSFGAELRTYVEDAGISPLSLVRWATRHPAELLGRGDDLGRVEAGKLADLVVVDGDPSRDIGCLADALPVAVLKGGEVVSGSIDG